MADTKYIQIQPEGMFIVTVERTVKYDTLTKMHYEFSYTVALRPTANDFINQFAALVVAHGKQQGKVYASLLGTSNHGLTVTLLTLTGAGVREWTDAFAGAVSEALLRETDWQVGRIARAVGFGSVSLFGRWFGKRYKRTPLEWRW